MREKQEILDHLDYRFNKDSFRNDDTVAKRSIEAICEVLIDIRDLIAEYNKVKLR